MKLNFSNKLHKFYLLNLLILIFLFINCSNFFENRHAVSMTKKFIQWYIDRFPIEATFSVSFKNNYINQLDKPAIEQTINELHEFYNKFISIEKNKLSDGNQINCEILIGQIRARLFELEGWRRWQNDAVFYVRNMYDAIYGLIDYLPDSTLTTERKILERLKLLTSISDNAKQNLNSVSAKNLEKAFELIDDLERLIVLQLPGKVTHDSTILAGITQYSEAIVDSLAKFKQFLAGGNLKIIDGLTAINKDEYQLYLEIYSKQKIELDTLSKSVKIGYDQLHEQLYRLAYDYFTGKNVLVHNLSADQLIQRMNEEMENDRLLRDRIFSYGIEAEEQQRRFLDDIFYLDLPLDYSIKFEWNNNNYSDKLLRLKITDAFSEEQSFICRLMPVLNEIDLISQLALLGKYNKAVFKSQILIEALPVHYHYWALNHNKLPIAARVFPDQGFLQGWKYFFAQAMVEAGYNGYDPKLSYAVLKQLGQVYFTVYAELKFYAESLSAAQLDALFLSSNLFHKSDIDGIYLKFGCTPASDFITYLGLIHFEQFKEKYILINKKKYQLKKLLKFMIKDGPVPLNLIDQKLKKLMTKQ